MSSLLFPTLLGLGWDITRTPEWSTGVQTALSGKTSTIAKRGYPLVRWDLKINLLRDFLTPSELLEVVGLFNAVQGRFDSFLYDDPDFDSVTGQQFGVGNGTAGPFQLVASYQNSGGPGYNELVQNLNGTPTLYDNGSPIPGGNYTIGATGLVLFSSYPASGHVLTWSGAFYYRCRFDEDKLDLQKMLYKRWQIQKLSMTSVKL